MIVYSKVTAEPSEPVTLDEVKKQVKMEGTTIDDTYLTSLISTARQACEEDTGRSFATQTRRVNLDRFPSRCLPKSDNKIILPYGPVQSISTFAYYDENGDAQTLTLNTDFRVDLDSNLCRIEPVGSWPTVQNRMNAITITYVAGWTTVPQRAKDAILRLVATLYEFRTDKMYGSVSDVDLTASLLLDPLRVYWNANQD